MGEDGTATESAAHDAPIVGCPPRTAADSRPERAFDFLMQGCAGADGRGCYEAGLAVEAGRGTAMDLAQAAILLERGCELANARSCDAAARLVESKDSGRALVFRRIACAREQASACFDLAEQLLADPVSDSRKQSEAFEAAARACGRRDRRACNLLWSRFGNTVAVRRAVGDACVEPGAPACFVAYLALRASSPAEASRALVRACERAPQACRCAGATVNDELPDGGALSVDCQPASK